MVDEYVKVNNRIEKPNANGPAFMVAPALADLYDRAMDNEPEVGALATPVRAPHDDRPRLAVDRW